MGRGFNLKYIPAKRPQAMLPRSLDLRSNFGLNRTIACIISYACSDGIQKDLTLFHTKSCREKYEFILHCGKKSSCEALKLMWQCWFKSLLLSNQTMKPKSHQKTRIRTYRCSIITSWRYTVGWLRFWPAPFVCLAYFGCDILLDGQKKDYKQNHRP